VIPVERAHLHIVASTHPGRKGKNNEDRYAVSAYKLGRTDPRLSVFAIVADGVGGHRAGEVAAQLAVETISRIVADSNGKQPLHTLQEAISQADQQIYLQAESNLDQLGMSTTSACAWVVGDRLYIASVGDSRIYLRRGYNLNQLTTDHTWVQEAIDSGTLTPEQAQNHPNAHVIRRHLGSKQPVLPDMRLRLDPNEDDAEAQANQGMRLQPGDQVLICSDGLTDLVSDDEILGILGSRNRDEALKALVDLANSRGGRDNITIVLLQMPERGSRVSGFVSRDGRSALIWFMVGFGSLLLLGSMLIGSLFWARDRGTPALTPAASPARLFQSVPSQEVSPESSDTSTMSELATPTPLSSPEPGAQTTRVIPTYTPWPTSTSVPE
jgi:serine/threonine protein phosphatase PrpC